MKIVFCCVTLKNQFFQRVMTIGLGNDRDEIWLEVEGDDAGWTHCPYCGEVISMSTN